MHSPDSPIYAPNSPIYANNDEDYEVFLRERINFRQKDPSVNDTFEDELKIGGTSYVLDVIESWKLEVQRFLRFLKSTKLLRINQSMLEDLYIIYENIESLIDLTHKIDTRENIAIEEKLRVLWDWKKKGTLIMNQIKTRLDKDTLESRLPEEDQLILQFERKLQPELSNVSVQHSLFRRMKPSEMIKEYDAVEGHVGKISKKIKSHVKRRSRSAPYYIPIRPNKNKNQTGSGRPWNKKRSTKRMHKRG
jgi:hypothetical protein